MPQSSDSMHAEPDASETPSDQSLLRRLREGEQDAATALYGRYARRLVRLAERQTPRELSSRVDAEDIVQSVFRTFFRRAAIGSYAVPRGEDLWKLLLVIALNKIRSLCIYHRAAKRNVAQTSSMGAPDAGIAARLANVSLEAGDAPERVLEWTVKELLADQPAVSERIVTLRIEGYEIAEIADRLHRSKRTVERVLQGFREKLSQVLSDERIELPHAPTSDG